MEWLETLKKAIDFMEEHLLEDISAQDVAQEIYMSSFYFQKGFKLITGYTVGEYIRNRRLYLAALDMSKEEVRVIDLANKYGYDTPESFTKAFTRFHGASPMQIRERVDKIKAFYPLQLSIDIKGGSQIDYLIEEKKAFKVIGIERSFQYEEAFEKIPKFWDEYKGKIYNGFYKQQGYDIGCYGICMDVFGKEKSFKYLIAGPYREEKGKGVPEGLKVVTIPALTWIRFRCSGPMPEAIQNLNVRIYKEWLPLNHDYEIASGYNIEVYESGDIRSSQYSSEIWLPIRKK